MRRSRTRIGFLLAATSLMLAAAPSGAAAQAFFNTGLGTFAAPVVSMRDMPFRTVVRQQYDYSCGSAALATLLHHHYGRPVGEAEIFKAMYATGDQAKIRQVGFSLLDMKNYLKSIGLSADGYRENLDLLRKHKSPAIAVINVGNYRHFVVVKGVQGGKVLVGDPALGLKAYSLAEFAQVWNGVVFMIHPNSADGAFNSQKEWGSLPTARLDALDDSSLASFTRELPPIYQITTVQVLP
ncbi:C39 family peptidase [Phenylobacterium deserti]|uniref:Peptidase C39 n=1 Tax=Phenylobacterium deserti TaxID=1914756 RepID=A0A328AXS3_9CAUL|nr:C39 family peptidase [Phenylobacterium deserti]RAK57638.1 peptidase C39 [Phenylobacterium deserti]